MGTWVSTISGVSWGTMSIRGSPGRTTPPAGVDFEVDHLAADGRLDLQALFGVAQGTDTFTGLDDVVLQFPGFTGGLFHKAVAQVFHAQAQFGVPLFGFGDGLAQSSPLAHVAGQIAFQLQDLGFFR